MSTVAQRITLIEIVEATLEQALRNGCSFKQIAARVPGVVATKMDITVPRFHAMLEELSDPTMQKMADRVVSRFSAAERAAIARKK